MFKRATNNNNAPPPPSTNPSTPPPPKNIEGSMKSKKIRKTKTGGAGVAGAAGAGGGGGTPNAIKAEKRRKSDQPVKKKKDGAAGAGPDDSVKKIRKSAEKDKKKKKPAKPEEIDSFEESKRKQKKPKKKSKQADVKKILMMKEEEEGSDRKKGIVAPGGGKEDNSSRRQLQPANVGGPLGKPPSKRKEPDGSDKQLRHPATAPAALHPEHPPAGATGGASPPKKNNSDKQLKVSDHKQAPGGERKRSAQLAPNNSSPNGPPPPPGVAPGGGAGGEDSDEDDEESSGNKTPPDKAEPNEGGCDLEPDAVQSTTLKDKSLDLAGKNETFTVGALKINTPVALKGTYGSGMVILKEIDNKKIDGYSVGAHLTIKFEKDGIKLRRLFMEIEIIKFAHTNQRCGVPRFVESGDHGTFHCLVIDGLGPSLGEIYDKLNGFSASTTFRIALITLDILRHFHSMLYVHRDIRPHSFYFGKDAASRNKIVLGQMGFARKYGFKKEVEPEEKCDLDLRKPKFKTKILHPRRKVTFIGAVRYAPRSSHLHKEHTRRDDMESWFYMLYEFLNKSLPWKTITDKDKILELKETFIMDQKFNDDIVKKYGSEMTNICEYFGVQNFFEMEPDYNYFELSILNLLKDVNKTGNDKFDWETSAITNLFGDRTTGPSFNEDGGGKKTAAAAPSTSTKT